MLLSVISLTLLNVFPYCFYGQMITECFAKMSDCLFDLKWQKFSPKFQKNIGVMLMYTQKPTYFHGFEVLVLNLNTFLGVSDLSSRLNTNVNFFQSNSHSD